MIVVGTGDLRRPNRGTVHSLCGHFLIVRVCECGEHYVLKEMMWPNFADCCDCATAEEYEEHMGAEALAEALAEMGWEK